MKKCSKCKEWKDESKFGVEKRVKSGLKAACIECYNKKNCDYRQTEQWKKSKQKYNQSEKGKTAKAKDAKKYRQTEKGKETMRRGVTRYHQTNKGRETRIKAIKHYREKYPERMIAHTAIANAKTSGSIPHASEFICSVCQEKQAVQYHHPDYQQPLYVIPVCMQCHLRIHGKA